jgi:hypothetical protein
MKMKRYFIAIFLLLLTAKSGYAQFTLTAIVPSSTNVCYVSGNFNSWSPSSTQMNFVSNSNNGTKTFQVNLPLTFLNSGSFVFLSGPAWTYQQSNPYNFSAVTTGISQTVTVVNFKSIYVPPIVIPLSANYTIYIGAAQNSYSFVNNDFAFYEANSSTLSGIIITSLPSDGTLTYNGTPITQTNVTQETVFADRTKFSFIPSSNRVASSFSFKLKDSNNIISQSYIITFKYNTPISQVVKISNNNYVLYKGLPYLIYGIQLRIDDYLGSTPYNEPTKIDSIYQYFQYADSAGFKDVAIPIPWSYIETADNVFNFSLVNDFIKYANTYNLRLQFLWFGSNVCGYSEVPNYISNDTINYPRISAVSGAPLDFSNSKLITKEARAIDSLMNYIAVNDVNKRVVMIQVENEPNHVGTTSITWAGGQKQAIYHLLDTLGQVIHDSPADMVTRVNLAGYTTDASDFGSLTGINIVGRDFYSNILSNFLSNSAYFGYPWNVNYTPENGAQFQNAVNLTLAAFDKGAGYMNYELRTTGWRSTQYDLGLYRKTANNTWIARDGTQTVAYSLTGTDFEPEVNTAEVRDFNEMIYKADKRIAASPDSLNVAFNTANVQGSVNETESFANYTINYTSPNGGVAFALKDENGDLILMSLKDSSSFSFQSLPPNLHISIGYFDDNNGWNQQSSRAINGNTVTLNAKEVALLTSYNYLDNPTSINEISNNNFSIYPNPSKGQFFVHLPNTDLCPMLFELISINGSILYCKTLKDQQTFIDVPNLGSGIYIVKLIWKENAYCSKVVID